VCHLGSDGGYVLVELGGTGQVAGRDAVQDCLPDLVRQPQGNGGQRDSAVWN
jgi:hypothetical protein